MPALQEACYNNDIAVTYVTDNHDMLSFKSENKDVISEAFPHMNIISHSPGLGAYTRDNIIWAEHGHRYTLFNAPNTWSRAGGHLPMGYFISRFAASKSLAEGRVYTTPEVLDLFVNHPVRSGNGPLSQFNMNRLDSFTNDPNVEEIAFMYDTIFSGWPSRQNIVDHYEAVINELGHLNSAANLLFEMPERIKNLYPFIPRIVLFGHTHQAAFQYHSGDVETIYVNTGTWIDKQPNMTWAEIEIVDGTSGQRDYTVSLWFYGEQTPRHADTISVQREKEEYIPRHR